MALPEEDTMALAKDCTKSLAPDCTKSLATDFGKALPEDCTIAKRRAALWHEGERFAAETLESQDWTIIARNWKAGRYEIDIIALTPEDLLVFVEVKARITSLEPGVSMYGLESITHTKRQKLVVAANIYLHNNNLVERGARLDVMVVSYPRKENAAPIGMEELNMLDAKTLMSRLGAPVLTHVEQAFY